MKLVELAVKLWKLFIGTHKKWWQRAILYCSITEGMSLALGMFTSPVLEADVKWKFGLFMLGFGLFMALVFYPLILAAHGEEK